MDIEKTSSGNTVDNPFKRAAGLSAVWQKCMSELYKSDIRLLIPKEHGQLGRLTKSLGMKQATAVVEYAIRNWGEFSQKAAKDIGSDIFPPKPCVGWLYKYHAIAVLMLHEDSQSTAKQQAKKDSLAKEAAEEAQRIAGRNAEYEAKRKQKPLTLERLKAIEAEVDAEFTAKEKLSA
jgi:hypothetical protein